MEAPTFADLGLRDDLLATLGELGYQEPTPIQAQTIPLLIDGSDVLGQAATGTGKTAAFALPILHGIEPSADAQPTALILVPTRELAIQVCDATTSYGNDRVRVVPIYGGQPIHHQLRALKRGVHIVVATPGRAIDHITRGSLDLDGVRTVVLDEADEMLDMGFSDDIEAILDHTPIDRQTVLFSATLPPRIHAIAERYQTDPSRIRVAGADPSADAARVRQTAYVVKRSDKAAALGRVLDVEAPRSALVFCKTRSDVDELTETLNGRGYRAEALHGGMDQHQRDRVMNRLRDGVAQLLVATDVAARGLDVDTLTHVVNYDLPTAAESYVHRIGRVGRAGREGVAITLVEPRQRRYLANVERLTKVAITVERVPTVDDLRAKQIEHTVEAIREALAADDLDSFFPVLHGLGGEGNDRQIALAAIKLAHEARHGTAEATEIPDASIDHASSKRRDRPSKKPRRGDRDDRARPHRAARSERPNDRSGDAETGFVYVGAGRKVGVRPADLVGVIANETDLTGKQIGPIRVAEHFSVVGVPDDEVDTVVAAIRATKVRGNRAKARRFVD